MKLQDMYGRVLGVRNNEVFSDLVELKDDEWVTICQMMNPPSEHSTLDTLQLSQLIEYIQACIKEFSSIPLDEVTGSLLCGYSRPGTFNEKQPHLIIFFKHKN